MTGGTERRAADNLTLSTPHCHNGHRRAPSLALVFHLDSATPTYSQRAQLGTLFSTVVAHDSTYLDNLH
jgi:hypothetical protein